MLHILDGFRDISLASVLFRLFLAVLCGGAIGMEREFKRQKAGFRTHILICLGASITTLTSLYLYLYMHLYTDVGRLGAQVVAGIGFIGAGCIIVTNNHRVRGLTTAAGLWSVAIIGLAIGAGFYEGALYATVLVLFAELVLAKLEYFVLGNVSEVNLYLAYSPKLSTDDVFRLIREHHMKLTSVRSTKLATTLNPESCAIVTLQVPKKQDLDGLIRQISSLEGIVSIIKF